MKAPEIASESEGEFQDLVFAISAHTRNPNGSQTVVASAEVGGEPVEVAFEISPSWKGGALKGAGFTSFQGTVGLRSLGRLSDRLVQAMDRLYKTNLAPGGMQALTTFTGISLEGNPTEPEAGPVKIKLFFESENEERYAELYLNIDLKASRVYLNEKDPEYRKPVIRALSASSAKGERSQE